MDQMIPTLQEQADWCAGHSEAEEVVHEQWDAIFSDQSSGPVSDADRQWWTQAAGDDFNIRQSKVRSWWRIGRKCGWAGVRPIVPAVIGDFTELVEALARGYDHGDAEREVDETMAAWLKLPLDELSEPERSS